MPTLLSSLGTDLKYGSTQANTTVMATSRSDSSLRSHSPPPRHSARRDSYTPPRRRSPTPQGRDRYRRSYSRTPPRRKDRDPRSRSRSKTPPRRRGQDQREAYPRSRSPRRYSPEEPRRERRFSLSRSRTPPRRRDAPRSGKGGGGFKWKEKSARQDDRNGGDDRGSYRGYRDRDPPRPRAASPPPGPNGTRKDVNGDKEPKKEKKKKAAPTIAPVGQEMIIVNVNDRLGTKASIPCLASDPISMTVLSSPLLSFPPPTFRRPLYEPLKLTYYTNRTLQSSSSSSHRPRTARDYAEAARRATLQRSTDA